ncbi:amidohydrolase [Aerococcus vaginalis]
MNDSIKKIYSYLDDVEEDMIKWRRHFHENAEKSFEEEKTAKAIAEFYEPLDCELKTNVGNGYGMTVDIDSGKPGKTIALRADFDALPIKEDTGLSFASKTDAMHACGHDGHTAYIMQLAKILIEHKDLWNGKVRILHQNAEEESPGGAKSMVEAGCLDGVDHVIGAHVMSDMPVGSVHYALGNAQTGRDAFTLDIKGQGGHASQPNRAKDAVVAAAYFVTQAQTVISRRVDPFEMCTVTIGNLDGTGPRNAVNGHAYLEGDIRYLDDATQKKAQDALEHLAHALEEAFEVETEFHYEKDYPLLHNDEDFTKAVVEAIEDNRFEQLTDVVSQGPEAPSEDFAYYASEVPSTFLWIGCKAEDQDAHPVYPHHHPKFYMDEGALIVAAKSVASATLTLLDA